jgi:hypothetical protein
MSLVRIALVGVLLLASGSASAGCPYWSGFPTDSGFFPIGVWLQSPMRAAAYKAIGINTFVGLYQGPTEDQLAQLAKYDMFAVAEQNDVGLNSVNRHVIKAWMHGDEPDNAQPIGFGLYGSCIPASEVVRRTQEMKSRDPTRPVMINFGQGVANEYWRGRGSCNGDLKYYDYAAQGVDISSFDIYPVGSTTPQVKGKLDYVARGVTNLVKRAAGGQRVWTAIETTALDPDRPVTPAQLRSEVWMALIHGAKGLFYFVHEFVPKFREDALFRRPEVVAEVAKTNQLIKALALVLHGPNMPRMVTVKSNVPIATMVKLREGTVYIFAVAMANFPSTPRFVVDGIGDTKARVIGEQRHILITQGAFEDSFSGYGVHLYAIPYDPNQIFPNSR